MARTSEERSARTAELALTKKAENVVSMDLRGLTSTCDFFVIASGTSDVQVKAIADAIKSGLSEEGEKPWHVEGYEGRRWVLLDYVDVVVHVFDEETRDYYQLERLWGDAKIREFDDRPPREVRPRGGSARARRGGSRPGGSRAGGEPRATGPVGRAGEPADEDASSEEDLDDD